MHSASRPEACEELRSIFFIKVSIICLRDSFLHVLVEVLHLVAHSMYEWDIVNCVVILAYCNYYPLVFQ
jgi:hypothetical protein